MQIEGDQWVVFSVLDRTAAVLWNNHSNTIWGQLGRSILGVYLSLWQYHSQLLPFSLIFCAVFCVHCPSLTSSVSWQCWRGEVLLIWRCHGSLICTLPEKMGDPVPYPLQLRHLHHLHGSLHQPRWAGQARGGRVLLGASCWLWGEWREEEQNTNVSLLSFFLVCSVAMGDKPR